MNNWVEGGMYDRRLLGRGKGRTRWIVTGGEGRVVATYQLSRTCRRTSLPLSKTRSTISPCTFPPFDFNSVNFAPYSSALSMDPMTTCVLVPAVDDDPFMMYVWYMV
jgi:hypothetical protein